MPCSNCSFYTKDTIQIQRTGGSYRTWVNMSNPNEPEGAFYDIAWCGNEATTDEIIVRDSTTEWFFDSSYYSLLGGQQVCAGQNDECPNYNPI